MSNRAILTGATPAPAGAAAFISAIKQL
jgi:hypothetical protein